MNPASFMQLFGNVCIGLATIILLVPLRNLMKDYARQHVNHDQWVPRALSILIPLWLLLMAALLTVSQSGGFDWLCLGRYVLFALTVAVTLSLAVFTFVFVACYIRPGFTPRFLYVPFIYLVPLSTMLLVVSEINSEPVPGAFTKWLRWPWTISAALSLILCAVFFGRRLVRLSIGWIVNCASRMMEPSASSVEILSRISASDPEKDFKDLLSQANRFSGNRVCEAATTRLRSHPEFLNLLTRELETGYAEPALVFLRDAKLLPEEIIRLAAPAQQAMQRWVNRIPAPNYTTKKNLRNLQRWGRDVFGVLSEKFADTDVDFNSVMTEFNDKFEATT